MEVKFDVGTQTLRARPHRRLDDDARRALVATAAALLDRIGSGQALQGDQMDVLLARLALHYPVAGRKPEQWARVFADFDADLSEVDQDDLEAACADWRRSDARWFPTPGQLLDKVTIARGRREARIRALQAIVDLEQAREAAGSLPASDGKADAADEISRMMAAFRARA